ncbi:unnamed protein product [Caenorhabditis auriculariae]|uniref:C2H2-type domain-containing protein n=1 Tax=Caenorhabditis auriculariae TaxID=2777116 RepID=A0A8S1HMA7_9PELO|nr:unnamed protein product [Caenorhabditis auriculariae]
MSSDVIIDGTIIDEAIMDESQIIEQEEDIPHDGHIEEDVEDDLHHEMRHLSHQEDVMEASHHKNHVSTIHYVEEEEEYEEDVDDYEVIDDPHNAAHYKKKALYHTIHTEESSSMQMNSGHPFITTYKHSSPSYVVPSSPVHYSDQPKHLSYGRQQSYSRRAPPMQSKHQQQLMANWQRDQKRRMDILEIMDALPPQYHDRYRRMFAKQGVLLDDKPKSHYLKEDFAKRRSTSQVRSGSEQFKAYGVPIKSKYRALMEKVSKGYPAVEEDYEAILEEKEEIIKQPTARMNNMRRKYDENLRYCVGCKMELRRSVYYHHARMIREHGACNLFTPQRFPCNVCDERLGTLEKLCSHLEQIHGAPTKIKTKIFDDEEGFQAFRLELEGRGGNFRMARGNKKNKKGVVQYFRCNRTLTQPKTEEELPSKAYAKPVRKRGELFERPYGVKQIIRTEQSCTAFFIKAFLPDGRIEVRYCDFHLHEDERLRLPEPVRERILEMSQKNLPHAVIIMVIKEEIHQYAKRGSANERRINDIKAQDVRQILAAYHRQERNAKKNPAIKPRKRRGLAALNPTLEFDQKTLDEGARKKLDTEKRVVFECIRERVIYLQKFFKEFDPSSYQKPDELVFNSLFASVNALVTDLKPPKKVNKLLDYDLAHNAEEVDTTHFGYEPENYILDDDDDLDEQQGGVPVTYDVIVDGYQYMPETDNGESVVVYYDTQVSAKDQEMAHSAASPLPEAETSYSAETTAEIDPSHEIPSSSHEEAPETTYETVQQTEELNEVEVVDTPKEYEVYEEHQTRNIKSLPDGSGYVLDDGGMLTEVAYEVEPEAEPTAEPLPELVVSVPESTTEKQTRKNARGKGLLSANQASAKPKYPVALIKQRVPHQTSFVLYSPRGRKRRQNGTRATQVQETEEFEKAAPPPEEQQNEPLEAAPAPEENDPAVDSETEPPKAKRTRSGRIVKAKQLADYE